MIYKVLKIEEDVDFGCEERVEGAPRLAVLTIQDMEENRRILRYPDEELYRLEIGEGDRILMDPKTGKIEKWII